MAEFRFTIDDFVTQMGQLQTLGNMDRILGMIPGMSQMLRQMNMGGQDIERQMDRMRAIYGSMTDAERVDPDLLHGWRRRRIARGAGVGVAEVDRFIRQFELTREMMRAVVRPFGRR